MFPHSIYFRTKYHVIPLFPLFRVLFIPCQQPAVGGWLRTIPPSFPLKRRLDCLLFASSHRKYARCVSLLRFSVSQSLLPSLFCDTTYGCGRHEGQDSQGRYGFSPAQGKRHLRLWEGARPAHPRTTTSMIIVHVPRAELGDGGGGRSSRVDRQRFRALFEECQSFCWWRMSISFAVVP